MFSSKNKEIIEDIQEELLLSGIGQNENQQRTINKHLKRLNNALEKLSVELYKKDTHFFLELIQNADDNQYADNVTPFIIFIITQKRIIVQNNELGFTEENVRSLCDVGESTKSDRYKGYIGEKGIGFKSVFKISDSPQIFSNGFHFRFRRENETDKLGFIVPHWVDDIPNDVDLELTNIVLPFNKDGKNKLIDKVTNISRELNHEVILFLNRIKKIEIINDVNSTIIKIVRTESDGIIKIEQLIEDLNNERYHEQEYYYKLIEDNLEVPSHIQEEKRENIKETKIILGFPVNEQGNIISIKQKVFAYLPVQEYGFNFLIQADFILPSNRENINNDNEWNKWLLENIPKVFLEAVEYFKQDNLLKYQYYNYLPRLAEIIDPEFSAMAKSLYDLLKDYDCILTESGTWRKPSEVLLVNEEIRQLFSSQDINKLIKKEYISNEVNKQVDSIILEQLGVQKFSSQDLLSCLQDTIFLFTKPYNWLIKLYLYLFDVTVKKELLLEDFKSLKILKTEDNKMISVDEGDIYLHIDDKDNYELDEVQHLKYISSSKAEKFLKDIGVLDNHPKTIIFQYIIPIFKDGRWKKKENKVLISLVKYIRDKQDWLTQNDIKEIKTILWIKNSHPKNCNFSKSHVLFFSRHYDFNKGQDFDIIEEILEPSKFISEDYIIDQSDKEISLWKDFFKILGVQEISPVKVIEYILEIFNDDSKWTSKEHETIFKYLEYIKSKYKYIDDNKLCQKIQSSVWIKNSNPEVSDKPNQIGYSKPSKIYLVSNVQQDDIEFLLELVDQNNYFFSNDYFKNSSEIQEWQNFFKWLGVKEITPYEMIKKFILPLYKEKDKSKNYLSKSKSVNIKCVRYVKYNFEEIAQDSHLLNDIQTHLWIQCYNYTSKSTAYWKASNLYFSREYNNLVDLESLFENIEDIEYVSPLYLESLSDEEKDSQSIINSWKNFFIKLGVNTKPKLELFAKIISFKEYERNILLLRFLDKYWKDYENQSKKNSYYQATWFTELKTSSWIPTNRQSLAKPSDVFIDKSSIRKILGDSVLYVAIELTNEEFIKDIGINTTPTVSAILDKIKQLSKAKSKDKDFLIQLYKLVLQKFDQNKNNILTAFRENNLIYIPNSSQVFWKLDQVFWNDCSKIFGKKLRGYLQEIYPADLYSFFVKNLGVKVKPDTEDYAKVLLDLSKQDNLTSEDKKILWRVYRELDKYLDPETTKNLLIAQNSWLANFLKTPSNFLKQSIIYTNKNKFSQNHENLFVNDDEQLFSLFQNGEKIEFLQLSSDNSHYQIHNLIKTIGIKYISHCVEIKLSLDNNHQKREALEVSQQIQTFLPYILRYLYDQENKMFKKLKQDQTLDNFKKLDCYTIDKLTVKYTLNGESVLSDKNILLDKNNNELYIQDNSLQDTDSLAIELAKYFGNVKGLEDFLITLFDKKTAKKIEQYLKVKKIPDLPVEEKQYFNLVQSELDDEDYLEDELESIAETNDFIPENDKPQTNVTSQKENVSNIDDLTISGNQSNNQAKTTSKHDISRSTKSQLSANKNQNEPKSNSQINPQKSQSTSEKSQNPSNSNSESSKRNNEDIYRDTNDDYDDEIDDIELNISNVDTRERVTTEVVKRPGQAFFRQQLLKLYDGKCVITGYVIKDYDAQQALIAAHIIPYEKRKDDKIDKISNGLLLRADIHTLFDLHLIAIDPDTMTVRISPRLANTKYVELEGKQLHLPKVSKKALKWHYEKLI